MKLSIERNTHPDESEREKAPWLVVAEIENETADIGRLYKIPIYVRYVGVLKNYHVIICGARLDAQDRPANLLGPVSNLLHSLLNGSRFPTYMFIARRARHLYPAYTIENEVFIPTQSGGPIFRHVELAKVREYLTDFLHDIKIVGKDGVSDKLHVRGVDSLTFELHRPVFYLKKRARSREPFWAPVFENDDGTGIYTIAASARREVPIGDGREVIRLREMVAHVLHADQRITDLLDLRTDRVMASYWERLQENLTQESELSVDGRQLTFYSMNGGAPWILTEPRPYENRVGLFFGSSADDVLERARRDFKRRKAIYDEI